MYPSWYFMLDTLCSRDTEKTLREKKNPSAHSCSKFLAIAFATVFFYLIFLDHGTASWPFLQLWHFCLVLTSLFPRPVGLHHLILNICIFSPWEKRHWQNRKVWNNTHCLQEKKKMLGYTHEFIKADLARLICVRHLMAKNTEEKKKICCRITKWPQ